MKLYSLTVRGKHREWVFDIWANPKYIEEWRADGLIIDEILNIIPQWWVTLGFPVRWYCWMQDKGIVL